MRTLAGGAAALVVAAVVLRLPYLHQVLDRDQALFAAIGRRLGPHGVPYQDVFDHKQPLVYPVYWALDHLGGHRVTPIRLAAALIPGLTAAVLLVGLRTRAVAAALLFTLLSATTLTQGMDLNTEHLQVLPATAAIVVALRGHVRAAGLLLGVTILAKASGAPLAVPLLIALGPRTRREYLTFAAGALAPVALVVLVYLVVGGLPDFVYGNLTYNRLYIAAQTKAVGRHAFPPGFEVPLMIIAGLVLAGLRIATHRDRIAVVAFAWLATAWAGAVLGGAGFPHYFAPCVPAAALSLALGTTRVTVVATAAVAVVFALAVVDVLGKDGTQIARAVYGPQVQIWTDAKPVSDAISREARVGDTLYVLGSDPLPYWYTGLTPAAGYLFDYPVIVDPVRYRRRLRRDLCGGPPDFVVDYAIGRNDRSPPCLDLRRYEVVARHGVATAYRLRPA